MDQQEEMLTGPNSSTSPHCFNCKTVEDEIRLFRDWSWQLTQFLNAIDSAYESEIAAIMDRPSSLPQLQQMSDREVPSCMDCLLHSVVTAV
jgi:hypothetical protein